MNYLELLMTNSIVDIEKDKLQEHKLWINNQKGGMESTNKPHGGFPPITKTLIKTVTDTQKPREHSKPKVSFADIDKVRKNNPRGFIDIRNV